MNWEKMQAVGYQRRLTTATLKRRDDVNYRVWRESVKGRDQSRCVVCQSQAQLEVHHLSRWIDAPFDRFKKENGVTLCHVCHKKGHKGVGKEFDASLTLKILRIVKGRYEEFINSQLIKRKKVKGKHKNFVKKLNNYIRIFEHTLNANAQDTERRKVILRKKEPGDVTAISAPAGAAK